MENLEPGRLLESSPDQLVDEIRAKAQKLSLLSTLLFLGLLLLILAFIGLAAEWEWRSASWMLMGLGLTCFLGLPWASWWDRRVLTTTVHYKFDELGLQVQEAIVRLLEAFERVHSVWSVRTEDRHGDWKRNAGAGVSVDRRPVRVGWGPPHRVMANVRVGHLVVSGTTLYFLPDRLLIYGTGGIRAISYTDLMFEPGTIRFVEEAAVPRDAVVVGTTWRYVNRDGGPDRRFNNNRQLPVVQYGVLNVSAAEGLRLRLQLSAAGLAEGSAALLGLVQAAIKDLQSREASIRPTTKLGAVKTDLPPLAAPAMKAAQISSAALQYRWLKALPEWGVPIVWGLVFALPVIASLVMFMQGLNLMTGVFMCIAVLFSGCGVPVLIRDHRRLAAERRITEKQAARSRFRAILTTELRSHHAGRIDFESLVADSGLSRAEADSVADELYRLMADRVVADGTITAKEQRTLHLLAKALRMETERASLHESQAIAARYHQAVSEVLADGVVTKEELRMLEDLRTNLGVKDADLPASDLLQRD